MLRAVRDRLRLIRYYSATRPYNRWSRAADLSVAAALLLAWPATWMLDRTWVRSSQPESLTGKLLKDPDGRVWALVHETPRQQPPRGDAALHGAFQLTIEHEGRGWPFVSSVAPPVGNLSVQLFAEQSDAPVNPAIEASLVAVGHDHAVDALRAGNAESVTRSTRVAGWLANVAVLSIALTIAAWLALSIARGAWTLVDSARHMRRRKRRHDSRCPDCGYSLRGSTFSERCPECGALLGV